MVAKSKVMLTFKELLQKQHFLRWFTAICVATITGMSSVILFLVSYWAGQINIHTQQLNTVITQNATILLHQTDQDRRILEDHSEIGELEKDDVQFKIKFAQLEGRLK